MITITEAGVYTDLPAEDYHAQTDWLSWSRMKNLVPPLTPAHFKAALAAPQPRKRHLDLGKVVHQLVLGEGDQFAVVQALNKQKEPYDADGYTTVSAQRHRDALYEHGLIPILRHELDTAIAMADAVGRHEAASILLGNGLPEVSLFWVDPGTGVKCRARLDWLPDPVDGRRLIVPDLKTADSAAPSEFAKAAARHGYFGQQEHYKDGIRACGLDADPAFLFVVVEKDTPHLVSVDQIAGTEDIRLARRIVDHCRRLYADCTENDRWPGYGEGVHDLELPSWFTYQMEEALA